MQLRYGNPVFEHSGIVHQDVNATESCHRVIRQALRVFSLADISYDFNRRAAARVDGCRRFRGGGRIHVGHNDARTLVSKQPRRDPTQTLAGSRDDRHLVLQPPHDNRPFCPSLDSD